LFRDYIPESISQQFFPPVLAIAKNFSHLTPHIFCFATAIGCCIDIMSGKVAGLQGRLAKYNVAHKLYKSSLLNTVCLVAGISIFFFGYDQGLMGGVNTAKNYAELMGFGHWDDQNKIVVVDRPLLQGGIVSPLFPISSLCLLSAT
jgi:hypothetical protein